MEKISKHKIVSVDSGSIADELGLISGDYLVSINGENIVDIIDYEQLITNEKLVMRFELTGKGCELEAVIEKDEGEDIGVNFESSLMSPVRSCKNHCIFCFIDQMPGNTRDTLHLKDDDFRLSLIMGNYVTLTNVDDAEFKRIIDKRVGSLYISVHATDGEVRRRMMRNPTAVNIRERLLRLKEANIRFHCQIVLCPGINDGKVLHNTLTDLKELAPDSVAVVPVGITKHRQGLYPLRRLTAGEAAEAIDTVREFRREGLLVYAADELYLAADIELPPYSDYDGFPQIENGVGLLRRFEYGFNEELKTMHPLKKSIELDAVCGVCAGPFLSKLFSKLASYGIKINTHVIKNSFFGDTVTVSGLVCGCDIITAYQSDAKALASKAHTLLLPRCMLRDGRCFLDGMRVEELSSLIGKNVMPVAYFDGSEFISELFEVL